MCRSLGHTPTSTRRSHGARSSEQQPEVRPASSQPAQEGEESQHNMTRAMNSDRGVAQSPSIAQKVEQQPIYNNIKISSGAADAAEIVNGGAHPSQHLGNQNLEGSKSSIRELQIHALEFQNPSINDQTLAALDGNVLVETVGQDRRQSIGRVKGIIYDDGIAEFFGKRRPVMTDQVTQS